MDSICSSVHTSKSTDLTREMCVPMDRWIPEQRIQIKQPRFHEAQRGWPAVLQSTQVLLGASLSNWRRICLCFSLWTFLDEGSADMGMVREQQVLQSHVPRGHMLGVRVLPGYGFMAAARVEQATYGVGCRSSECLTWEQTCCAPPKMPIREGGLD